MAKLSRTILIIAAILISGVVESGPPMLIWDFPGSPAGSTVRGTLVEWRTPGEAWEFLIALPCQHLCCDTNGDGTIDQPDDSQLWCWGWVPTEQWEEIEPGLVLSQHPHVRGGAPWPPWRAEGPTRTPLTPDREYRIVHYNLSSPCPAAIYVDPQGNEYCVNGSKRSNAVRWVEVGVFVVWEEKEPMP